MLLNAMCGQEPQIRIRKDNSDVSMQDAHALRLRDLEGCEATISGSRIQIKKKTGTDYYSARFLHVSERGTFSTTLAYPNYYSAIKLIEEIYFDMVGFNLMKPKE